MMNKSTIRSLLIGEFSFKRLIRSTGFIYIVLMIYAVFWSEQLMFPAPHASYRDDGEILRLKPRTAWHFLQCISSIPMRPLPYCTFMGTARTSDTFDRFWRATESVAFLLYPTITAVAVPARENRRKRLLTGI